MSKRGKSIETERRLLVSRDWVERTIRSDCQWVGDLFMEWWECSKLRSWWWSYSLVHVPKITEVYTFTSLNFMVYELYLHKVVILKNKYYLYRLVELGGKSQNNYNMPDAACQQQKCHHLDLGHLLVASHWWAYLLKFLWQSHGIKRNSYYYCFRGEKLRFKIFKEDVRAILIQEPTLLSIRWSSLTEAFNLC